MRRWSSKRLCACATTLKSGTDLFETWTWANLSEEITEVLFNSATPIARRLQMDSFPRRGSRRRADKRGQSSGKTKTLRWLDKSFTTFQHNFMATIFGRRRKKNRFHSTSSIHFKVNKTGVNGCGDCELVTKKFSKDSKIFRLAPFEKRLCFFFASR